MLRSKLITIFGNTNSRHIVTYINKQLQPTNKALAIVRLMEIKIGQTTKCFYANTKLNLVVLNLSKFPWIILFTNLPEYNYIKAQWLSW